MAEKNSYRIGRMPGQILAIILFIFGWLFVFLACLDYIVHFSNFLFRGYKEGFFSLNFFVRIPLACWPNLMAALILFFASAILRLAGRMVTAIEQKTKSS